METTFTVETLDSRTQVALQKQKVQHLDAQFVHGDTFIARTLAMVAMQEDDQQITEELLSDHGNFLLVQTAAAYVTAGGEDLSFLDVAGRALEHGEILVGTMTGANDKIDVNPENKREQRRWAPTDRILHILPLHHLHGLVNKLLCALWAGASVAFSPAQARELQSSPE